MNKNLIDIYKKEINEYENMILETYSNLVYYYEQNRQLYEKIIYEYENQLVSENVICSKISAKNHTGVITEWLLERLEDGTRIYTSNDCLPTQTTVIDLTRLNLQSGTKLKFKAHVLAGKNGLQM